MADEYRLLVFGFGASRTEQQILIELGKDIGGQLRKLGSIRDRSVCIKPPKSQLPRMIL